MTRNFIVRTVLFVCLFWLILINVFLLYSFNMGSKIGVGNVSLDVYHASAKRPERRLPQAIIIGVPKAGTGPLLTFLVKLNNRILTPGGEVHFFNKKFEYGLEFYRKLMPYSYEDQVIVGVLGNFM